MRKTITFGIAIAVAVPATATAAKPPKQDKPVKPKTCEVQKAGYNAKGTYVSGAVTQTAGADTAGRGDDRYSGDVVIAITKANHKSPTGEQTFTLADARVRFHKTTNTTLAAGDRIKLSGTVTKLAKKCDATDFTSSITVRKADIKAKR